LIGPIFLREGLVAKFKDHISSVPYCIVIHNAKRYSVSVEKKLATEEVSSIVNHFLSTRYPIVCSAGSKSSIPFWDYHIALTGGNNDEEVFVSELLVREPKDENVTKGILMAYYMLINKKHNYEKLVVPMELVEIKEYEDIIFEYDSLTGLTYLYPNKACRTP